MSWLEFLQSLWTPEVATAATAIYNALILALLARLGMQGGNKSAPASAPTTPAETPKDADPLADFPILKEIAAMTKRTIPGPFDDILIDTGARILDRIRQQRRAAQTQQPPTPAVGDADQMDIK